MNKHTHVVGFDIDGVITDEMLPDGRNVWHRELEDYFGGIAQRNQSFLFTEAYGLDGQAVDEFMRERAASVFEKAMVRKGVRTVLNQLVSQGFEVHLITARDLTYQKVTESWLLKNQIPHHRLWLAKGKGELSRRLGIECFVDDHWDNCRELMDANIPVAMMNMPHNQSLQVDIVRVDDWAEIWGWYVRLFGLNHIDISA